MGIAAIVRKLHRWELQHLREHCTELHVQLEALQAENEELRRSLAWAEDCAERWRDDALLAIEDAGATPGLTQSGHVIALHG